MYHISDEGQYRILLVQTNTDYLQQVENYLIKTTTTAYSDKIRFMICFRVKDATKHIYL